MSSMIDVIEELKGAVARIESVVDDLEADVSEQEKESRKLPFDEMNKLIGYGFTLGAIIEIDGKRRYVFQGFYEWNHDIVAQFKSLTDDENKDKIVSQDAASLVDCRDRWKILKEEP